MGACQSRQSAVVVSDDRKKPELLQASDVKQDQTPSVATNATTGMTCHESSEFVDQNHHEPPIPEEVPIESTVEEHLLNPHPGLHSSDISLSSLLNLPLPAPPKPTHHNRKKSETIIEYLRADPAENRVMVHIENPLGVPIEEVYDGVHDGEVLGEGITGKVRLITHKDTKIQRALKRLDLSLVTNEQDLNSLLDEVKIMCALDHPNIVCLEEVYEGDTELYLTQELCGGGDLFDRLEQKVDYSYTEAECARLVMRIISSVSYLHSKNIIHRDLKLENFLFQDNTDHSELKMIDFGLSKHFHTGEVQHESVGTPYTVAPEVISGKGYDEKADVWSIGVITYLLLSGETPFGGACEGEDLMQVRQNILSGKVSFDEPIWSSVSDLAKDFINGLLCLDPKERPSTDEARQHPWILLMKRNSSLGEEESKLDSNVVTELKKYKEYSHTMKFLCEVISFTLQPDQISGLREEFEKLDENGNGEISLEGFKYALLARPDDEFPMAEWEIEEIFNGLKTRNSSAEVTIRWHEFIAACLSQCHIDDRNIRLAFDRLDTDHKGYVTLDDLKTSMDFYGSDKGGLQDMWINEVMDYKKEKDNLTIDDFYKILKVDRRFGSPRESVTKSASSRPSMRNSTLTHAFSGSTQTADSLESNLYAYCRHNSVGAGVKVQQGQDFVSSVRVCRDMQDFLVTASKRLEDEKKVPQSTRRPRRNSLIARKDSQDQCLLSLSCISTEY